MKYFVALLLSCSLLSLTTIAHADTEDCSPEYGYFLGKSGEPLPTTCPPELRTAFEKSYNEGQQEFYQISLWEDTLNALDLEIAKQEQQRHELDSELDYLQSRIEQLHQLIATEDTPQRHQMLTWAETEFANQKQQRRIIEEEIHRLQNEKYQQKPW
jgi:hypothetical protein